MNPPLASLLAVLAAGGCTACAWIATSWGRADRRWLRTRAISACRRARRAAARLTGRARSRLRGEGGAPVTLGDVSEMIDVVRLGLLAGLSFDASLELYGANRETELAALLSRALMGWRVGVGTREEELAKVAAATGIKALEPFAVAVGQAIELGAPLSDVLASQEREIRQAHRARLERVIEKAPVKLLIPTGTLILPALLLSIMGPLLAASGML